MEMTQQENNKELLSKHLKRMIRLRLGYAAVVFIQLFHELSGHSELKKSSSSTISSNPSNVGPFLGTDLEREEWNVWGEKLGIPYFVPNQTHIVYAPLGHTTYLHCIVGNLGDRQISWIRSRDHRIVAIGKFRYTQDTRFTPMNEDGNEVWVLKIQNARLSDSGNYECQISYHDDMEKKLKMPVRLRVLDSKAKIGGSRERHVQSGSRLSLSCRIDEYTGPPIFVFWYRNSEVINYSERKSILIRSGNFQHTVKYDKRNTNRRSKSSTGENERSSPTPTTTFMLSKSHNPIKTNISKISEKVQNDILHEDISRYKIINQTSTMKQKSSISIAQVDNANDSTNSWNQSPSKRRRRKFKRRRRRKNVLVSTLEIFDVRMTDGGVYTCAPSNAKNHSVIVHVVKGENLAMQREIDKTSKLEAASSTASNIKTGKYMALGVHGSCVVILSSMLLEWLIYIQEKI